MNPATNLGLTGFSCKKLRNLKGIPVNNEQPQRQQSDFHSDEIDLFELIESIWKEKLLIIIITALATSLAVAYALITKPTYQTTTIFYQPSTSAIQDYNLGRSEAGFSEFKVSDIYDIFLTNLNSQQLRNEFFEEVYLPSLTEEEQQAKRSALLNRLNSALTVKQANAKENKDLYQIVVELQDPEIAAQWANLYLQKAIDLSKKEIATNIDAEIEKRKSSITLRLENSLEKTKAERQDEIIRLKEALRIANDIGIVNPSLPDGKSTQEGANYVDRNLTYMRGTKALKSQIEILETRKNDLAFVPDLQKLIAELNLLNALSLNFDKAEVVRIDKKALIPDTPIKPKKTLTVLVGGVLGGMLGVFAALLRTAIRQRKQNKAL